MTLEGIFGTALDVSATFIILFSIYGAVLAHSGAGEFFIDFALARRKLADTDSSDDERKPTDLRQTMKAGAK